MENQHRKITGHRELSQAEVALMNEIKAVGEAIHAVGTKVVEHLNQQSAKVHAEKNDAEFERIGLAEPQRWVSKSKTDFQTGLMALTRAVAQPTSF